MVAEQTWPNSPTSPPPDATMPIRHPNAVAVGTELPSHYDMCYGCGAAHPAGLHMRVIAGELSVQAVFEVTEQHQGAPGLAHGGLLGTAFDEALGALNWLLLAPAVTARLETDFKLPVPVGSVLHIDARIVGKVGRKVYTRAVGRLGEDGPVALAAAALFLQVPLQHFADNGRGEDVARAARQRRHEGLEVNP